MTKSKPLQHFNSGHVIPPRISKVLGYLVYPRNSYLHIRTNRLVGGLKAYAAAGFWVFVGSMSVTPFTSKYKPYRAKAQRISAPSLLSTTCISYHPIPHTLSSQYNHVYAHLVVPRVPQVLSCPVVELQLMTRDTGPQQPIVINHSTINKTKS